MFNISCLVFVIELANFHKYPHRVTRVQILTNKGVFSQNSVIFFLWYKRIYYTQKNKSVTRKKDITERYTLFISYYPLLAVVVVGG